MAQLTFVIPTRRRHRELSAAIRSIAEQVGTLDVKICVIYNEGDADTLRAITRAFKRWPFVYAVVIEGDPDYSIKFRAMMRVAADSEWVWTFGDDDVLMPGALKFMMLRLSAAEPDLQFIHVAEKRRSAGTGDFFTGRLIDIACALGWLEITGFITGNITRGAALAKCADSPNWGVFSRSAFCHSLSLLETLLLSKAMVWDQPLVDTQDEVQTQETLNRWESENTAWRYFLVNEGLDLIRRERKLPAKFFRYMNYHLWDRHITYFISALVVAGTKWSNDWSAEVKRLAGMIEDESEADEIRRDVDTALSLADDHLAGDSAARETLQEIYARRSAHRYRYAIADTTGIRMAA